MKVECAECNASEEQDNVTIDYVCHHCGKPLCRNHAQALKDAAFAGPRWKKPTAYHCTACKQRSNA